MNATFFRSTHDGVLAMWEFAVAEQDDWAVRLFAETQRLQRHVVQRTVGLCGRVEIVGLGDEGDALPGWALGERGFLIPADGPAGANARQWLAEQQPPPPAEHRLAPFGLPTQHIEDGRIFWPGLELLDDGLYVSWDVDTGWNGSGFFTSVPAEEYQAAQGRS